MSAGPDDRASSRRLVAGLVFALLFPTLLTWLYFVRLAEAPTALQQGVYLVGKIVQFAFPAAFCLWMLGRLPRFRRTEPALVVEGLLSGLVLFALTLVAHPLLARLDPELLAEISSRLTTRITGLGIDGPGRYVALAVFYSLAHSLLEEYYWRWFVYGRLRQVLAVGPATALGATGFAAHHLLLIGVYVGWDSPLAYLATLAVAAGGFYWCRLYERSRSLTPPWLSHALVDAAVFFVGWRLLV